MNPLSDNELIHLLEFVGYGELDAPIWFVGMEEAGGGEDNIRRRLEFRKVEDCAEAHRILGITKHHWGRKVIQRTWRGMCVIMLHLSEVEPTRENIRQYQANSLGRYGGQTLLTELMPIPKSKLTDWGYEDLISHFSSREDYYARIKPKRITYLRSLITNYQPRVVICYGKAYWEDFKTLFPDADFKKNGQFEISLPNRTLAILTDHFTARSMNNKFAIISSITQNSNFYK